MADKLNPLPWKVRGGDIIDSQERVIVRAYDPDPDDSTWDTEEQRQLLRRIVASVNVCSEISIPELEDEGRVKKILPTMQLERLVQELNTEISRRLQMEPRQ